MNLMATGDGNRVWFPEMIQTLRSRWNAAMPFPLLIELCNTLDGMFQRRRSRGPTLPPGSRCPECGRIVGSESQQRHSISVRATILSLRRFRIASSEVTKRTEKNGPDTGREPTRYIWPPYHFNCGKRRQGLDVRTRNARAIVHFDDKNGAYAT